MPEIEMLKQWLRYDAKTGKLYWISKPNLPCAASTEAGTPRPDGYLDVKIEGKTYKVHRVAWALYHGKWPSLHIDHKDGSRANNCISNLREATRSQNLMNAKMHSNNTSGHRGVHWYPPTKKWVARISLAGEHVHLGYFRDLEEAVAVRNAAALKLHPEFARAE